ncbi:MAG TPA: wax ester/triacylglycerol synthase family O-acyltransferase [Candidatus Binatia bacterium]|nr:wax ester/triacylglycerol synthase family O-acyltransferase [Candidatus Binatia bacterium]
MARRKRLSPLDASFLYWERPHQRMHVGCLALLDGPVPFDAFAAAMEERLGRIERWHERPVRPLFDLDWPHWEADGTFEVRRHLRHVAVPPPGGERELHELVDSLFATRLDPRRPLWETFLIDGLSGGRSALLCKVHHSMIDGVSGAQLLEAMSDPAPHPAPQSSPHAPAARTFLDALRPSALLATARDAAQAVGILGSVVREAIPTLPFNGPITDARRIVWTSFALDDFLTMRGTAGCKVNDVVLAVIAGAMRRYLQARGVVLDGVRPRVLVPVSVRRADDHMALGNLVSSMFPHLPIDVADPIERLRHVAAEMRSLKEQGQPRAAGLAMQMVGALPAPVNALLARVLPNTPPINTVCTNVPGPRDACHLLGRRILAVHPIVPLFQGLGMEFAIMSYAGQLSITAAVEPHLVPDEGDIAGHLQAAAEELHDALAVGEAREPAAVAASPSVAELMTADPITITPGDSLAKAYALMRLNRIRHLPVVAGGGGLAGLLTHRDLLAASSSSLVVRGEEDRVRLLAGARAADVMETHVSVAAPEDPAALAGERMIRHKIGCLPVVGAGGRLAGIVTEEDFLRWATAHMMPSEGVRESA